MGSVGVKSSLLLISLCLISVAPSWAQVPERFLTYENPDFNIRIQYPSDWIKSEENLNRYQVVAFSAPEIEQSQTSLSSIVFTPANFFVSVIPVPSENIGLQQFVDQLLNETYQTVQDYRIINSSRTTFAGTNNALSMVMYEYAPDKTSKVMRNIAINNGTGYMIKYAAEPGLYDEYLPIALQMSNSLQIGSSNLKPIQSVSSPAESTRENQTTQPIAPLAATTVGENQTQPLSPQPLPLPKPPSNTITGISSLPQTITLSDNTLGESKIPLRAAIINGTATNPDLSKTTRGQLYEWYPIVSFHFEDPGNIGLVNVKHVLTGPIKSYQSPANILEEAIYFQNVPLNEQVSLEVSQPGLTSWF